MEKGRSSLIWILEQKQQEYRDDNRRLDFHDCVDFVRAFADCVLYW